MSEITAHQGLFKDTDLHVEDTGGPGARSTYGSQRVRSAVFASAATPDLPADPGQPRRPADRRGGRHDDRRPKKDEDALYDGATTELFSANGVPKVSDQQRQDGSVLRKQADKKAALACMAAFGTTDVRDDLTKVTVPPLVLHGDSDAIERNGCAGRG